MLNIGVVCDISWDNFILIDKKFKKICSENFRINAIYSKTLEMFNNCSSKYNLTIIRHYSENLCNTLLNMLKICDIWLIFTNSIEYLSISNLIIEKCDKYKIKYCTIKEYDRHKDYYSFDVDDKLSFKKIINNIKPKEKQYDIDFFNLKDYNDNFNLKQFIPISISPTIKNKIKSMYETIDETKKSRSIKLLYDKDEIKREKQVKKTIKEAKQLQFLNNRISNYNK